MENRLLEYYTSLTQQHRQKLTFLLAMFIGITQVLAFLPKTYIDALQKAHSNFYMLLFGVSAFLYLLLIGIGHHINNLISASTCRVRHETYLIKAFFNNKSSDELKIDHYLRDYGSLSKVSGIAALIAGSALFGIVCYKVHAISQITFQGKGDTIYTAAFTSFVWLSIITIIFYISTSGMRLYKFYIAQRILRFVRSGKSDAEINEYFQHKRKI